MNGRTGSGPWACLAAGLLLFSLTPAHGQALAPDPGVVPPGVTVPLLLRGQDTHFGPESRIALDTGLSLIWYDDVYPGVIYAIVQVSRDALAPQILTVTSPLERGGEEIVSAHLFIDPALSGSHGLNVTSPEVGGTVPGGVVRITGSTEPHAFVSVSYLLDGVPIYSGETASDSEGGFTVKVVAAGSDLGDAIPGREAPTHALSVTSVAGPGVHKIAPRIMKVHWGCKTPEVPLGYTFSTEQVVTIQPAPFQQPASATLRRGHYIYSPCNPPDGGDLTMFLGEEIMFRIDGWPPNLDRDEEGRPVGWTPGCAGFDFYWTSPGPPDPDRPIETGPVILSGASFTTTLKAVRWGKDGLGKFCARYCVECPIHKEYHCGEFGR